MLELLLAVVIAGIVLWGIDQLPMDATIKKFIRVIVIVIIAIIVVKFLFALLGGGTLALPRLYHD